MAEEDAEISNSLRAFSTCKTDRKHEYWFWNLFVIQMSFPKFWEADRESSEDLENLSVTLNRI